MSESTAGSLLKKLRKIVFGVKFLRLNRNRKTDTDSRESSGWDFRISFTAAE